MHDGAFVADGRVAAERLRAGLEYGEVHEACVHVARRHVGVDLRHGAHDLKLGRDLRVKPRRLEPFGGGAAVDGGLRIGRGDGLDGLERDVLGALQLEPLAPDEDERRVAEAPGVGCERIVELLEARLVGDDDVDAAAVLHLGEHLADVAAEALLDGDARLLLIERGERVDHLDVACARRDDDLRGVRGARGKSGDGGKGDEKRLEFHDDVLGLGVVGVRPACGCPRCGRPSS